MFSLELNRALPPPPGISQTVADATCLFSSLSISEFQKSDEEYFNFKEKMTECSKCEVLVKICDKMFAHKQKALACLIETFNLVQKETVSRLRTVKELEELKNSKGSSEELTGPYKKIKSLLFEIKKKDKILTDLSLENRELTKNRINVERLLIQLQKEIALKTESLKKVEESQKTCEKCAGKEVELKNKAQIIRELQENAQFLSMKMNESFKITAEREIISQKMLQVAEVLEIIPEVNGRELRMSIHRKICEIETDFMELAPNHDSFEVIKAKYLQLPYLLKPIFDLTKQFEKSIMEIKTIIYT